MTFISSWATEHRLLITADTVSSDSGKKSYPPIKVNVDKIHPNIRENSCDINRNRSLRL